MPDDVVSWTWHHSERAASLACDGIGIPKLAVARSDLVAGLTFAPRNAFPAHRIPYRRDAPCCHVYAPVQETDVYCCITCVTALYRTKTLSHGPVALYSYTARTDTAALYSIQPIHYTRYSPIYTPTLWPRSARSARRACGSSVAVKPIAISRPLRYEDRAHDRDTYVERYTSHTHRQQRSSMPSCVQCGVVIAHHALPTMNCARGRHVT